MPLEDIPEFLKLTQEERRAAWEKFRSEQRPLPPERKPYRPINSPISNGAIPDDDT